ncbi:PTS system mannose/fructose/sorbose family transporter subunit IID [Latilactobacillus graminis]|uniref:Phosphotransferase system, mannose fructose N-acetylgalactosamine-specific component IID n=2 Tax=Latilactobacillus graminis TaxID=60519 RepID=A0AA89I1D8_9LACO|nr:PTS system mannose/fructose/sorbose family transporter subunit IID [Latilactobacillus graminis]KRM23660.1 phosphotransferase system, mannose fructose N-acetylgalactosamine-specific component IID [Latilactobacillus graminis DSM 20719]QFP80153.1 PTS system mannose/fructose/sorbose family transporter subunit IID [Latilactobacillus graminis]
MNKLDKKDINKVYWRNLFGLQWGWNYERMQGLGYSWVVMPALKKLYKDDKVAMSKALKTHLGFFNTSQPMSHLIIGADLGIEEKTGMEDEMAIVGLKTGLMGPFAGVGDTIFLAIYRAIIFSIASYMALSGSTIGLLLPIIGGVMIAWVRYKFTWIGYRQGTKLVTEFADQMKTLTEGASILGLTVVGALIPSVVNYSLDLKYKMGKVTLDINDMMNQVLPSLAPLLIVLFSYWLLGKKKMNSTRLIFVLIALGMLLGNLKRIFGL